jgi:hypothetical protein
MQRYYIPALGNLWASLESYAADPARGFGIILMARLPEAVGMFGGIPERQRSAFDRLGYHPGMFWGTLVGCTDFRRRAAGDGLFTRPAALSVSSS